MLFESVTTNGNLETDSPTSNAAANLSKNINDQDRQSLTSSQNIRIDAKNYTRERRTRTRLETISTLKWFSRAEAYQKFKIP